MLMICEVCRTETDISLEQSSGQAVCSDCGGRFAVGDFVKKMLVETRSVIKDRKSTGFMYACLNCSANREAKIKKGKGVCAICGTVMNIPPAVLKAISARVNVGDGPEPAASDRPMIETSLGSSKKIPKTSLQKVARLERPKKKSIKKKVKSKKTVKKATKRGRPRKKA